MSTNTSIEWTDVTWNPVRGCSRCSPGCFNCYAERSAIRQRNSGYKGLVTITNGHPAWTGVVRLIDHKLAEPLHLKKPKKIFVNSMSDLFHEALKDEEIAEVFRAMHRADWHTYQILTKRAERMAGIMPRIVRTFGVMPHVQLGVSVENDEYARKRLPFLEKTPAAVRFVSYEPALGPIAEVLPGNGHSIDWIIAGGESGPSARPNEAQWFRDVRDWCQRHGRAFFFKQWGGVHKKATGCVLDGREWREFPQLAMEARA